MTHPLLPGIALSTILIAAAQAGTIVLPDPLGDLYSYGHQPPFDITEAAITVKPDAVDVRITYDPALTAQDIKLSNLILEFGTRAEHRSASRVADWGLYPIETVNYYVELMPYFMYCDFGYFDDDNIVKQLPNLPVQIDQNTLTVSVPRSDASPLAGLLLGSSFDFLALTYHDTGLGDICWNDGAPYAIPVPEPALGLACGLGLALLGCAGRRSRRTA